MDKCGTFYWTTCAVHCIDLILENMAKLDLFPINASTIEKARKIPTFICNNTWILNILRKDFTKARDLNLAKHHEICVEFHQLTMFL